MFGRAVVVLAVSVSLSCFRTPGRHVEIDLPASADLRSADEVHGPLVIVLDEELSSHETRGGAPVRAHLGSDLIVAGRTMARRGAVVCGVVLRAERAPSPLLALDFTYLETPAGPVEIRGWLHGAQPFSMPDRAERYDPQRSAADVFLSPWAMPGPIRTVGPPLAIEAPDREVFAMSSASEIRLPAGVHLRLDLARPPSLGGASDRVSNGGCPTDHVEVER